MINKSYSYLIPLINVYLPIDPSYFILVDQSYAMINGNTKDQLVALTYEKADNNMFQEYLNGLKESGLTENVIESEDKITFILKIPEEFSADYNAFIEGKFSKFSTEAKNIVIDYVSAYHKPNTAKRVRMVLDKSKELKAFLENKLAVKLDADLDLSSIPREEEESFNYNIL